MVEILFHDVLPSFLAVLNLVKDPNASIDPYFGPTVEMNEKVT